MKILLGVTGSVAATLSPKICKALRSIPHVEEVNVVTTENGRYFLGDTIDSWPPNSVSSLYLDSDEWMQAEQRVWDAKGDPVVHIDLRDDHSVLVIAPLTANTLAKMANGICDNLLLSIYRAWDICRPVIIAPAMNTYMWEHPITNKHLDQLQEWGMHVVDPQEKELACGTTGVGAMADIANITNMVRESLRWEFPLSVQHVSGIPVDNHPGSFGYRRRNSHHTGVDLYTAEGSSVYPVENGRVIKVEAFTGPQDGSPWWNDTDAILVEGASGVVCYGEIKPHWNIHPGRIVKTGTPIGNVIPVLPEGKERPDISGHSRSMLHLELYRRTKRECSTSWELDTLQHDYLLDPTSYLLDSAKHIKTLR